MISIVLTVHNKDSLVEKVLSSITTNSHAMSELIVVLDGCTDKSAQVVERFFTNNKVNHKIIVTNDVFETKANNEGLKNVTNDYSIILQDDMVVDEMGWDKRLISPLLAFDDIFAVGAKNAHNNYLTGADLNSGKDLIKHGEMTNAQVDDRKNLRIRNSINRGPIAFKQSSIEQLNFFDEEYSPYTWDDHDLCYRAFLQKSWKCGSFPVKVISKKEWGTTRNKNFDTWKKANLKNQKTFCQRYFDVLSKQSNTVEERVVNV